MPSDPSTTIESVLHEQRVFEPPAALAAGARIGSLEEYRAMAEAASADPDRFWGEAARRELHWFEPFHTVLDWRVPPFARWFEGGTTNLSYNCLDRHLAGPTAEKTALIWEGEPGDVRRFSYRELHAEVCKAANALKAMGIGKGDLWRSTCRWCRRRRSPCWPAPASVRPTRWCSAASRPMPCATG